MKIAKFQWSFVVFAAFFSLCGQAMHKGKDKQKIEPVEISHEQIEAIEASVILADKANKIITLLLERNTELALEPIAVRTLTPMDINRSYKKLNELLDWFHAFLEAEKKLVENNNATTPERYASWALLPTVAMSILTLDMVSTVYYGLPAAYFAHKVMAPDLKKELGQLRQTEIKINDQSFNELLEEAPENFVTVVQTAQGVYKAVKDPHQSCALNEDKTHCQANKLLDGAFYQPFLLWKKGNDPVTKIKAYWNSRN